eukprot:4273483-Amphidinium_carterae.2
MIEHQDWLVEAKLKEWRSLFELGCFRRLPRTSARNLLDGKWVLRWKEDKSSPDGRKLKARITLRGFKEWNTDFATFAGTATRLAQRMVAMIAAVSKGQMTLEAWDVSSAFARGLTFRQLSEVTGEKERSVQLMISPEDLPLIQRMPGFEDFDIHLEDAPRSWELRLKQLLLSVGVRTSIADPRLYLMTEEDFQQHYHKKAPESGLFDNRLLVACSTRVDDIKAVGRPLALDFLVKQLEEK